ncbi:MAG: M3 family peptidase [Gemmatimonadales bacterium]|nr:MAG: M3 family peptidase [Gemmatimonadales bacterium]
MNQINPFLDRSFDIPFDRMSAADVRPAVQAALREASDGVARLAADADSPLTWDSTVGELDRLTERLRRVTNPIHHLLAVAESPALREAWTGVLPQVTTFWARLYLNRELRERIGAFSESEEARGLDDLHQRHLRRTLREFDRAGAGLPDLERARLEAIDVELSQLEQTFSENVLDATAAWTLQIRDGARLDGIPEDARDRFRHRAEAGGMEGWVITLDAPAVQAVLKHATDRDLRAEIHSAYLARGTEAPWDNRPLIPRILELRREKARLLGYADFPDFRLEEQMAKDGEGARTFLEEMVERTRPYWIRDFDELRAFALETGLGEVRPWDTSWLAEQLRKSRYDLDEEELRPYFPLRKVMDGLFELARRLFALEIEETATKAVWHPDVRYYTVRDASGMRIAAFYADLFPRPEKRQGAWMSDFIYGVPGDDEASSPHLANMCANFPPPSDNRPALLAHRDVETLFHEFGHLLHHCTSRVPIEGRGGINVAWDWVELPSQFMENWSWEQDALALISGHWATGEPIPDPLFERMKRARRFLGGWAQMRQLSLGIMDLALHGEYDPETDGDAVAWASDRILHISPTPEFAAANPLPSFLHLFSGGYAASYYSYLWSEVLEADLFGRFRDEGIFSRELGQEYMDTILSRGDAEDPDVLFRRFMGRDPDPEALLRRNLGEVPAIP